MGIFTWLKNLDSARRKARYKAQTEAFEAAAAALTPDDIAVDCGANVGIYTEIMARSGATVYAFEPNPVAFAALQERVADFPNVKLFQAASTVKPGSFKLYSHRHAKRDPLLYSVSSSLISAKSNVNQNDFFEVEGIVLSEFLQELNRPVKLLKMDVEGAEIEIINDLLDKGLHQQIVAGFVEVHDRRVKSLREPTAALRERLEKEGATQITLDWR
ncbi:FkbM family methyltransferase [Aliidiomarina shirensis]|uniref:FkbM family methyltransferase n=1 Tax=Aliidiomarina shirensis TaxID=1048642 RepID=A0A432WTB8_9GAMM|nr:FkbM family methyltransferase [Aliidiomarina shirensis]RUO36987.1 FkbM family methyltransferase [Aliidiomarina shirensis]